MAKMSHLKRDRAPPAGTENATSIPAGLFARSQKIGLNGLGGEPNFSYWRCYKAATVP